MYVCVCACCVLWAEAVSHLYCQQAGASQASDTQSTPVLGPLAAGRNDSHREPSRSLVAFGDPTRLRLLGLAPRTVSPTDSNRCSLDGERRPEAWPRPRPKMALDALLWEASWDSCQLRPVALSWSREEDGAGVMSGRGQGWGARHPLVLLASGSPSSAIQGWPSPPAPQLYFSGPPCAAGDT